METDEPEIPTSKIPKTDSITKLAEFWDTHDLTDFEGELEEIPDLVSCRRGPRSPR